jgi:hypothetical protein
MKRIFTLIGILMVLMVIYVTTRFHGCMVRAGLGAAGRSEGMWAG